MHATDDVDHFREVHRGDCDTPSAQDRFDLGRGRLVRYQGNQRVGV
jgi:hypothetical protein